MFCIDFSDKVVALTANRKLSISKFYEFLSEPQTNQPQFITECSHCVCHIISFVVANILQDVGRLDDWLKYSAPTLRLFWFRSLESNTTKDNNFFTISYRILENKRLFFKKMYEIRMKQVYGELIKKSTIRYSIARFRFCYCKFNSKTKKNLAHGLILDLA